MNMAISKSPRPASSRARPSQPPRVLMVDVGGTNVKMLVRGVKEPRKFSSPRQLTAEQMVAGVLEHTQDWKYDVITVGFPGLVRDGQVARNPLNLGGEWEGFDFSAAFKKPARVINDAAMQALAHYREGRMLFVGFGTSIGTCLIADDVIVPVETGLLRLAKDERFMDRLTKEAFRRDRKKWQHSVEVAIALLRDMFWPDHVVLGGGNSKHLDPLPEGSERVSNREGIRGAIRLWEGSDMVAIPQATTWRIERARR